MARAIVQHWHFVRVLAALTASPAPDLGVLMADLEVDADELRELLDAAAYYLFGRMHGDDEPGEVLH